MRLMVGSCRPRGAAAIEEALRVDVDLLDRVAAPRQLPSIGRCSYRSARVQTLLGRLASISFFGRSKLRGSRRTGRPGAAARPASP